MQKETVNACVIKQELSSVQRTETLFGIKVSNEISRHYQTQQWTQNQRTKEEHTFAHDYQLVSQVTHSRSVSSRSGSPSPLW